MFVCEESPSAKSLCLAMFFSSKPLKNRVSGLGFRV